MSVKGILGGTVHAVPADMKNALAKTKAMRATWESLTPLARNEWICWTISVKKPETRLKHVKEMLDKLKRGARRPCCWIGCIHRKDKAISPSVKSVLARTSRKA